MMGKKTINLCEKDFEKWARKEGYNLKKVARKERVKGCVDYIDYDTSHAFKGWCFGRWKLIQDNLDIFEGKMRKNK